jgi:hypothetical protein
MITLHDAIYAINTSVTHIRGEEAFDVNDNPVHYDLAAAHAKLVELQAAEAQAEQEAATAKASALAKLTALGLTSDEITALVG